MSALSTFINDAPLLLAIYRFSLITPPPSIFLSPYLSFILFLV